MKNSNPLKYFNDQADARRKKLAKAQAGVAKLPPSLEDTGEKVYQGPLDEQTSGYMNEMYPSTSGKGKMPRKTEKGGKTIYGEKMGPGTAEMYNRSRVENDLRSRSSGSQDWYGPSNYLKKKGGSVKSRKK